ncbi:MAG: hypothetical protein Q4C74_04395 [Rothia sp. (in: high G+C Gram-positive bacteria)]|nr:hypothetical protein [Rothia sp. (in: high G+C Gram-positive bacteria)]
MPSSSPKSTRDIENFTLNVVLYISSLLLMTSAALFANTLAPAPVKIGLLLLATALFYLAGLWTYYKLAKLRLASYFFCATAIALLPINGFVAYNLAWHNGPALWLCTSLLGTLLLAFTCLIMPARILGYLFISFLVSDVLSSSKLLQLSILYYFLGLIALASILKIFSRLSKGKLSRPLELGLRDTSLIFIPVTMLAVLILHSNFSAWEISLLFFLASCSTLLFLERPVRLSPYLQLRLYPLIALISLGQEIKLPIQQDYLILVCLTLALLAHLPLILSLPQLKLPWSRELDAYFTWCLAAVFAGAACLLQDEAQTLPAYSSLPYLPLWLLPLLTLASLLLLMKKLAITYLYLGVYSFLLLSLVIIHLHSAPVLFLGAGILFYLSRRQASAASKAHQMGAILFSLLASYFVALKSWSYLAQTYLHVVLVLIFTIYCLIAALRLALGQQPSQQRLEHYIVQIRCYTVSSLFAVLIVLCTEFNRASLPYLQEINKGPTGFWLYSMLLISSSTTLLLLLQINIDRKYQDDSAVSNLDIGIYLSWLAAVTLIFSHSFVGQSSFSLYAAILLPNIVGLFIFRAISLRLHSALLRGYLLLVTSKIVFSSELNSTSYALLILFLLFLSLVSWACYSLDKLGQAAGAELVIGLSCLLLASSLTFLYLVDKSNSTEEPTIGHVMILLSWGMSLLWWWHNRKSTQIILALVTFFTVLQFSLFDLSWLLQELNYDSWDVLYRSAYLIYLLTVLVLKAVAAARSSSSQKHKSDPWGPWGRFNSPWLIIISLVLLTLLHQPLTYSKVGFDTLLSTMLLTLLWTAQVAPPYRPFAAVTGASLVLGQAMDPLNSFNLALASAQLLILGLLIFVGYQTSKKQQSPPQARQRKLWLALYAQGLLFPSFLTYSYIPALSSITITLMLLTSATSTVLAAFHKSKKLIISSALLITLELVCFTSYLNFLTMFLLGLLLLGLVIWRLLVRGEPAQAEVQDTSQAKKAEVGAEVAEDQPQTVKPVPHYGSYQGYRPRIDLDQESGRKE